MAYALKVQTQTDQYVYCYHVIQLIFILVLIIITIIITQYGAKRLFTCQDEPTKSHNKFMVCKVNAGLLKRSVCKHWIVCGLSLEIIYEALNLSLGQGYCVIIIMLHIIIIFILLLLLLLLLLSLLLL